MTVVQYEQPPPLPPSRPGDELLPGPVGWVARLRGAAEYASHIANTDFVPQGLRGNPAAIAAAILYGDEVGLTPMQSLAKIAVIKGRASLTAEAQRSLILARGHELWLEESTTTRAIAAGRRVGSDRVGRVTWTLDDAKRAGIAGGQNWRSYPREMLVARATAALARQMFADVIGGLAAAEELEGQENGVAAVVETVEAPKTRRRSRPSTAPAPLSQDAEQSLPPIPPTPPPDLQPDPPPGDEPLATDAQKRRIFALMRNVGVPDDRDRRLAYVAHIIGHPIESSNDLTRVEAGHVIDDLEALETVKADAEAEELKTELDG